MCFQEADLQQIGGSRTKSTEKRCNKSRWAFEYLFLVIKHHLQLHHFCWLCKPRSAYS